MYQAVQDSVSVQALPLIVIQWKQLLLVVSAFSTATIAIVVAVYRGWKVVSSAFALSVQTHAVPVMTAFKNEVTSAMGGLERQIATLNQNLEHLQISDARRAEDLSTSGKRLEGIEECVHAHDVALAGISGRVTALERLSDRTAGRA